MSVAEPDVRSAPERSREATRRRLLEAGTTLFAEQGLHGVTSARIARAAGVATGTFYLHFPDKHALFHEIAFAALADLRDRQDRAAAGLSPGGGEELRARTGELFAFAEDNRDLIRVVFGRGAEAPAVAEAILDEIVPAIERRFEERRAAGETPADLNPTVAAQAYAGMTARVLSWWIDDPTRASREEVVHTLLRMHPTQLPDSTLRI